MRQVDRTNAILELLSAKGKLDVAPLASKLKVSESTIRRDLERLESQHLLSRTHGGAIANGVAYDLPLRYRESRRHAEKLRIARAAATLVTDGMTVGLTGGTTTTEVARALGDREYITIVTNAINIASELAVRPNLKLVLTGGVARPESYELVGPLADATLAGLTLDVAFIGADGVTVDMGLTAHHEIQAHTCAALARRAKRVVAVVDSSKIGVATFARICGIDAVDDVVTDKAADKGAVKGLRNEGVSLLLA